MKPPLYAADDRAGDALGLLECLLELVPALFAARLVAGEDGFVHHRLDALEINFDFVADLQRRVAADA